MGVITFVVELLFVERIVKRIVFQCVDPHNSPKILLSILISFFTRRAKLPKIEVKKYIIRK